ncbi:MAG TPA: ferredoxin [Pyrinomonadaceae bacterium]|nr:ferredoxin [Pyrinomonadaceae bacterium]
MRIHRLSAKGKYYVFTDDCDICGMCEIEAPNNFKIDEKDCYNGAYVFKQPETQEEQEQCKSAVFCCPTKAILDDGEINNQ